MCNLYVIVQPSVLPLMPYGYEPIIHPLRSLPVYDMIDHLFLTCCTILLHFELRMRNNLPTCIMIMNCYAVKLFNFFATASSSWHAVSLLFTDFVFHKTNLINPHSEAKASFSDEQFNFWLRRLILYSARGLDLSPHSGPSTWTSSHEDLRRTTHWLVYCIITAFHYYL